MGNEEDEGHPILADWVAGTSHQPCAGADREAGEESSFDRGTGEGEAAYYGACLCSVRVVNTVV